MYFNDPRRNIIGAAKSKVSKCILVFRKNPNQALVQYAMDYNAEIPTRALTTTPVWCGDF